MSRCPEVACVLVNALDIVLHSVDATLASMGSPYSQDLRLRVLASVDAGMSKMTAHRTFRVSRSTIDHWIVLRGIVLRAQTGSVEAKTKVSTR